MEKDECFLKYGSFNNCIDNCDPELIPLLKNEASKKSFTNWLVYSPMTPSYIEGPMSFTKHTRKNDDDTTFYIYIFGEYHSKRGTCYMWRDILAQEKIVYDDPPNEKNTISIANFLANMIETSPVFLDIFLETGRLDKGEIEKKFEPCFLRDSVNYLTEYIPRRNSGSSCKKQANVRVHAIDSRSESDTGLNKFFYWRNINTDDFLKYLARISELAEKIDQFDNENNSDILKTFFNEFLLKDIVKKEYDKLSEIDRTKLINILLTEHFTDLILLSMLEIYQLYHDYQKGKISHSELLIQSQKSFSFVNVLSMDLYTISRLFKGFKTKNDPIMPYNSIIYTGNSHSENYRKILEEFGFEETILHVYGETGLDFDTTKKLDKHVNFIFNPDRDLLTPLNCTIIDAKRAYPMFDVKPCTFTEEEIDPTDFL